MISRQRRLKQTPHIVAFLDFLGATGKMSNKAESDIFLLSMKKIFDNAKKAAKELSKSLTIKGMKLKIKIFSDNIFVACKIPNPRQDKDWVEAFLSIAHFCQLIQANSLLRGLLIRGGISYGNLFIDNTFVYGDGLVKAYKLESDVAIYPRILVDKVLIKKLSLSTLCSPDTQKYIAVSFDFDGQMYLLPFHMLHLLLKSKKMPILETIKEEITEEYKKLSQERPDKRHSKYYWLASKYNDFCEKYNMEQHKIVMDNNCELVLPVDE